MEQTGCSETSVFKLQTPENNPEERVRHSKYGESLKSRSKKVISRDNIEMDLKERRCEVVR
jgi:hypothetical protein